MARPSAPSGAPVISVRNTFRRFWPHMKGGRRLLLIGGTLAVAAATCEVAAIWLFGVITDQALAAKNLDAFWTPALAWLGLLLVTALATFTSDYVTALAGERFLLRPRDHAFAHVQRLSQEFFDNRRLGDLMARLSYGDGPGAQEEISPGRTPR